LASNTGMADDLVLMLLLPICHHVEVLDMVVVHELEELDMMVKVASQVGQTHQLFV
jgi:hypothetical protein